MSTKRRDTKGRILKEGESQKPNGKYSYKYRDASGKYRYVESWRLVDTDRLPAGKRPCEALRTMEANIKRDLEDGIDTKKAERTVVEQIDEYLNSKTFNKASTKYTYNTQRNIIAQYEFAQMQIGKVTVRDCERLIKKMFEEDHRKYNSIKALKHLLTISFESAIKDEAIRTNPFNFSIRSLAENNTVKKTALTQEELADLLDFIREDTVCSKYYDEIFILFHTGMRISEFCGITDKDIDFEKHTIKIERQLCRLPPHTYYISTTKRQSSTRTIPITEEVCDSLKRLIAKRTEENKYCSVDGISNFLSFTRNGTPRTKEDWLAIFRTLQHRYKREFNADPPNITPHICRHTYATILAQKGFSPKTISYILGHSTIVITMNTYVDCSEDSARNEFEQILYNHD